MAALVLLVAVPQTPAPAAASEAGGPAPYTVVIDLAADIRALGADDPFVSEPAVERLVTLGPLVLPALTAAMRREPPAVRAGVVDVARQLDDPAAVALLVDATRDANSGVRAAALLALALGDARAGRAAVEAGLRDPDARARRSAILACARLCTSPEAIETLVELAMVDREAPAARQSLSTLLLADDRSATVMRAVRAHAVPALDSPDAARRVGAAFTAAVVGEARSAPILAAVLQRGDPTLKPQAALALGGVPTAAAVAALAAVARGGEASVAAAACVSLARLQARNVAGAGPARETCPGEAQKISREPAPGTDAAVPTRAAP